MPGEMVQVASSTRLVPNVCALYAEGDTVIALFDAERMARDGKPYRNTYSWYVQMRDGMIVNATAFFDLSRSTKDHWKKFFRSTLTYTADSLFDQLRQARVRMVEASVPIRAVPADPITNFRPLFLFPLQQTMPTRPSAASMPVLIR